ncbi:leucyl/phenylalanyl-tRNA--protein transferase [Ferrimicrobium sp.]|uniref:leucyl/phenylalanyl-tRNA--protein transferase n=1 Tax=Ferrimicrobium sp. TaxID=2926050 RepID=UPI00260E0FB3|nr:leucyl/phenylalanyl-tRNA--protein transferase [Ferrimicrobium sp.]
MTIEELVAFSASLDPDDAGRLYRLGIFPMPLADGYGWFYPATRAVIVIDEWSLRCPRSTEQLLRTYRVGIDIDPMAVVSSCAKLPRPGGWIDQTMIEFYRGLKDRGLLHSVEVRGPDDALVGGLFGVGVGGIFVGESMFHLVPNASKLALFALVRVASNLGYRIVDGQWPTDHLATLGFATMASTQYAELLLRCAPMEPALFPTGLLSRDQLRLRDPG